MAKRRGLGKPLASLLGDVNHAVSESTQERSGLRSLPIEQIHRGPFQPRKHFDTDSLQELAQSISEQGVVQPIVVRPLAEGYELVAGERRWRAAQVAGLHEIPATVRELDDRAAAAVALIENIQREDLNPLEEAIALQRLIRDFELTHAEAALAVGRSRAAVSNLLRLLELHPDVQQEVTAGRLEMGHARALAGLPTEQQPEAAAEVIRKSLSVRETERLVQRRQQSNHPVSQLSSDRDPDTERTEQRLSETLGAPVRIHHQASGAGRLEIRYHSLDELDGIIVHLGGKATIS